MQRRATQDKDLQLPADLLSTWIQPCLKLYELGNNIYNNIHNYSIISNFAFR